MRSLKLLGLNHRLFSLLFAAAAVAAPLAAGARRYHAYPCRGSCRAGGAR